MFDWDENIFAFGNGGFKIKVFYVHCHPACIGRGDVAVCNRFDCGKFCCWCDYFSAVLDPIATYSPPDLSQFFLVWADIGTYSNVGWGLVLG